MEAVYHFGDDGELQLVPHYPPHSMRHTCASWLVQRGVSLYEVQHLLGHESFQTTQRHAHLQPDAHKAVRVTRRGRPSRAVCQLASGAVMILPSLSRVWVFQYRSHLSSTCLGTLPAG